MERRELRRLARARFGLAVAMAAGATGLLLVGGARAFRAMGDLVQQRDVYAHHFLDIELVPEPPRWIKPGRVGLLKGVLERSGQPGRASALGRDLAKLDAAFRHFCPWIGDGGVLRVERSYPRRIAVHIRAYREPVAVVPLAAHAIVIDADAVVLPDEELDRGAAGPLVRIDGLSRPEEARPGLVLKFAGPPDGEPRADRRAEDAARLAGFLKPRLRDNPPFRVRAIRPTPDLGLCLLTADKFWIVWGEAPGAESAGNAPATRKWALLREWFDGRGRPALAHPQYLDVSRDRVELVSPSGPDPSPSGGSADRASH